MSAEVAPPTSAETSAAPRTRAWPKYLIGVAILAHCIFHGFLLTKYFSRDSGTSHSGGTGNTSSTAATGIGAIGIEKTVPGQNSTALGTPAVAPNAVPEQAGSVDLSKNEIDGHLRAAKSNFMRNPVSKNIEELDAHIAKLGEIPESTTREIITLLQESLGTKPINPVHAGRFDLYTGQIQTIRQTENSKYPYFATMIDANGNQIEVSLSAQNGKAAFEVMRRLDKSVATREIYEHIAMPLMVTMMESKRPAEARKEAESRHNGLPIIAPPTKDSGLPKGMSDEKYFELMKRMEGQPPR